MSTALHLRFHKSLYRPEAVQQVAARFAHLGTFVVEDASTDTLVAISEFSEELQDRMADTFSNHVLHQSIVLSREAR